MGGVLESSAKTDLIFTFFRIFALNYFKVL